MIDYKTASKDQLKAEMKRLSAVVSDTPFGTKKEFSIYLRFLTLMNNLLLLLAALWITIHG